MKPQTRSKRLSQDAAEAAADLAAGPTLPVKKVISTIRLHHNGQTRTMTYSPERLSEISGTKKREKRKAITPPGESPPPPEKRRVTSDVELPASLLLSPKHSPTPPMVVEEEKEKDTETEWEDQGGWQNESDQQDDADRHAGSEASPAALFYTRHFDGVESATIARLIGAVRAGKLRLGLYSGTVMVDIGPEFLFCSSEFLGLSRGVMARRICDRTGTAVERCHEAFDICESYLGLSKEGKWEVWDFFQRGKAHLMLPGP